MSIMMKVKDIHTSITTTMQSTNMVNPPMLIHIRMEMIATLGIRMITVRTVCAA
ncbi:hypothetical protein D3C76_1770810 [compost metagenome]